MADVGEIRGRLVIDSSNFSSGMKKARDEMTATSKHAAKVSKDIKGIQEASLAVGTAVAVGMGAAVMAAANFEKQMSAVEAVSGASQEEMKKLNDLAIELGSSTSFSAGEVAMAIEELVKAGVSVSDVIGGGLKGALDLAAAGNIDLASAAEIASTALNAFKSENLSVVDAANILAGAANASATDVGELKFGLSQVSAVASSVGMTFQDTATALAIFAQNGLKGSDAGTSLKTMLSNLQPTTKAQVALFKELGLMAADGANAFFDQEGRLKSLSDIAGILRNSMSGMTDQQRMLTMETIFGSDAIRASNILYKEGTDGINAMWDAMSKVTAADVAKTKLDNLLGSFEEFKGALETLGISIGNEFLPMFRQIVEAGTALVRVLTELNPSTVASGIAFVGATAAIAAAGAAVVKLGIAFRGLYLAMGPAGWLITGLSLLGGVVAAASVEMNAMKEVNLATADSLSKEREALGNSISQYDSLRGKLQLTTDELSRFVDINSELQKTADPTVIARLKEEQAKLQEKSGLTNGELSKLVSLNDEIAAKVPDANNVLTEQGNILLNNTDAAKRYNDEQLEMIRLELESQRAKAEANMADNLEEEERILARINSSRQKGIELETKISEQVKYVSQLEGDLARAKAEDDSGEVDRLNNLIERENHRLGALKKQKAEHAGAVVEQTKKLDKVQQEIGKLDEVRRRMVDIELKQVGINAKKGQEIATIDKAISKLQSEKQKLQDNTSVANRKTDAYRSAVGAIDNQISRLNTAKSRVQEITGAARTMNAELSKAIEKRININRVERTQQIIQRGYESATGQRELRHNGGPLPKLHVGGSPALLQRLQNAPMHNEIDARLLRNEMVLTEAQQANLFRMIDAGFTNAGGGSASEISALVNALSGLSDRPIQLAVNVDGYQVAEAAYPFIDLKLAQGMYSEARINGVKLP